MRAPITSAQAMSHPTVVETINALGAIADEQREHKERFRGLLFEVAANYTRDDDLPDDLLPRIDAALALPDNAESNGRTVVAAFRS